jgi:hypothetical protein
MNVLKYLFIGFVFGIVLTKSEAVSWYRIYEMFQFQSFHMYGIIAVAILTGLIGIQIIKRKGIKDIKGQSIVIIEKEVGSLLDWRIIFWIGLGTGRFLSRSDLYSNWCRFLECVFSAFWCFVWDLYLWAAKR